MIAKRERANFNHLVQDGSFFIPDNAAVQSPRWSSNYPPMLLYYCTTAAAVVFLEFESRRGTYYFEFVCKKKQNRIKC